MSIRDLCGWVDNPAYVEHVLADTNVSSVREFTKRDYNKLITTSDDPVLLYEPLLTLHPNWKRGAQGIGDCVSWGWELAGTVLAAIQIVLKRQPQEWKGEFATEPIYGGSRVEARGGRLGGYSDGSYGAAAAKWVTQWGMLLRTNYATVTGNEEHNLTKYDSRKAKAWGNFGCGGKDDERGAGKLDAVAKEHPIKTAALVTSFEQAAEAIKNGYPIPVCSGQGFASKRDSDGFCAARGSWAHCMLFCGYRGGSRPGLLCANSWGRSVSGPTWPDNMPNAMGACAWWVDADTAGRMLARRDSFAVSNFIGFRRQDIDWSKNIFFG